MSLEKIHVMVEPPQDWLTESVAVGAEGNFPMQDAAKKGKKYEKGAGSLVIKNMAELYKHLGIKIALFDDSKAEARVTTRILGEPNPDKVFTVDAAQGHVLPGGGYVNIVNNMTATPRLLDHFVMQEIMKQLGVQNIVTQPKGANIEGGDYTHLTHAFGLDKSLLVTGEGPNSRSNQAGRDWLLSILHPGTHITILSENFHRDLVSAFAQDAEGALVQAFLALHSIKNADDVFAALHSKDVPIINVPSDAVPTCALNLFAYPGGLIGMQIHSKLMAILRHQSHFSIKSDFLPDYLQKHTAGFTDMQGGANCVSGSFVADAGSVDISPSHVADINERLHSKSFEDELQDIAERLEMKERVTEAKHSQGITTL